MLGKACQLPIEDQHQYIRNFYFAYKKDTEQIDDVLLLGVML
jgi:hypothetical protein